MSSRARSRRHQATISTCVTLAAAWFLLLTWSDMAGSLPGSAIAGGLAALALLVLIVIQSVLAVGWWGAAAFFLIGYGVGFTLEAMSINTGVPFGWFKHLVPGPRLLGVPLYIPLCYPVLGWMAWALACLLARHHPTAPEGPTAQLFLPILGALILTGYDMACDPIGSTVKRMWVYRYPGGFSGVPPSNFVGWAVTGWVIFSIFTAVEPRFVGRRSPLTNGRGYWLLPCLLWVGTALQYPLLQLAAPAGEVIAGTRHLVTADIYETATIVALLVMLPLALAAAAHAMRLGVPGRRPPTRL